MESGAGGRSDSCPGGKKSLLKRPIIIIKLHLHQAQTDVNVVQSFFRGASFYLNYRRRSSHFFISGNNPIAKLPEYLETMLGKMAKEMPGINSKQDAAGSQEEEVRVIAFISKAWTFFVSDEHGRGRRCHS